MRTKMFALSKELRCAVALAAVLFSLSSLRAAPAAEEKKPSGRPTPQSAADQESEALDKAFQVSPTDPQEQIKSLEDFLARFPGSAHREQVLRLIYRRALESNDRRNAAAAMERLVALYPQDPDLLGAAADLLDRQGDAASRAKAIEYASRCVESAEKVTVDSRPAEVPAEKWPEVLRATAYALRGRIYAKAGQNGRAVADFEKSLAVYASASVAEQLGDAAMKAGDLDRAIDAYAMAFVFPDKRLEPAWQEEVRRKLGSAYVAKHSSEKGLGEAVLTRYDELMRSLAGRSKSSAKINADTQDPLQWVLGRLDGSSLNLADFRGKFLVMDFWATWCPPCRMEGRLFERVIESFHGEPRVAFLSVNTDEDRASVSEFLKEEKWTAPVVYAQGLDRLFSIRALPTVLILDPEGRVVFRQTGLDLGTFVETLEGRIREALKKTEALVR